MSNTAILQNQKKYVLYFRVSTKGQGKSGLGLESQKAILSHYIKQSEVIDEFTDIVSGSNTDRIGLTKAINLCKSNGYTLAVAKVDRLSRNTKYTLEIYDQLKGNLFFADLPISNDDMSAFKMLLTFHTAIAEREKELIRIRTIAAFAAKRARGEKLGTPENMTNEGREKAWRLKRIRADNNPNNIKLMNYVFTLKTNGESFAKIAERLNKENQTTPSGNANKFFPTTIKRLYDRKVRLSV